MSLTTFSLFYFGHTVTASNDLIDFNEGGPELTATLNPGSYTLTDYVTEIKRAMDAVGALTYTVSVSRSTRFITISSTSTFALLVATGTHSGISAYPMIGFTGADRTGASTYTGNTASGSSFSPQFILQDHVPTDNFQGSQDESVNISSTGQTVEVIKFGSKKFLEFTMKYSTDISQPSNGPIRTSTTGVADLVTFMEYLITKAPIEYMPNESVPNTFQSVFLESTGESQMGTSFKLKERYDRGLPEYFDTSLLRFRLIE